MKRRGKSWISKITTRQWVQLGFVVLTVVGVFVIQGNAERWCPFGGVEAAYNYATEGNLLCSLGVSNFYILGAVLLITLLARRAFCGYACPIGAISEWLRSLGKMLRLPNITPSHKVDRWLSPLKYGVLVLILWITWPNAELHFRAFDPCYAMLSRNGEDITFWAYVVVGGIVLFSLLMMVPFCRYLCPFAAVLNPLSRIGVGRIWRNEGVCTDCGKCTRVCPMGIQVASLPVVNESHCTSCTTCIDSCYLAEQGAITWGPTKATRWPHPTWIVSGLVIGLIGAAVAAATFAPMPSFIKTWDATLQQPATLDLNVEGVACRGSATNLVYYLERDDELMILPHISRLEATPGPGYAPISLTYDASELEPEDIKMAITEAYFDLVGNRWRSSPFKIEGYDPLDFGDLDEAE